MTRTSRKCRHFYGSCDGIVVRTLVPLFCGSFVTDVMEVAIFTEVMTRRSAVILTEVSIRMG